MKNGTDKYPEWGYVASAPVAVEQRRTDPGGKTAENPQAPPAFNAGSSYDRWQPPASGNVDPGQTVVSAKRDEQGQPYSSGRAYECLIPHRPPGGRAIASFALGVISLVLAPLSVAPILVAPFGTGLLAVALGLLAVARCKKGAAAGKCMAVMGVILGAISVLGWLALLFGSRISL